MAEVLSLGYQELFARYVKTVVENPYIHHEPTVKQAEALMAPEREILYGGAAGGGKGGRCPDRAAPLYDESMEGKVLTPQGFKLIGDVQVGDRVCNPDGTVTDVVALHDNGIKQFYRVTLSDGASVEVDEDHIWSISIAGARKRRKKEVPVLPDSLSRNDLWNLRLMQRNFNVGITELQRLVARAKQDKEKGNRARYVQIPLTAPVAQTSARGRWPVMPSYVLGVLVGDGCVSGKSVSFSSGDPEVAEMVEAVLPDHLHLTKKDVDGDFAVYGISGNPGVKEGSPQELLRRDRLMGCHSWDKFVPPRILKATEEERFSFLRGLFDADGHMDDRGHVEYVTVSKDLVEGVRYLLRSLGYKATLATKQAHYTHKGVRREVRLAYRLYVQGDRKDLLFGLKRKADRVRPFNGGETLPQHRVVSVEPTVKDYSRCITVSHPNGLYITDDFIVTHNSDWILMSALQYVHVEKYAAIIFRKTYKDLAQPGAIMDRAKEWIAHWRSIGLNVRWNEHDKVIQFPSGARIVFAHLQHENEKYNYQGAEFQFIAFDELTQFTSTAYRYLRSRLRRLKGSTVPLRIRSASNPGGTGHIWVKTRFVDSTAMSRTFIPARLEDNPYLDYNEYVETLLELDPVTRDQLLNGDWTARMVGGKFRREWFDLRRSRRAPYGTKWLRFWDLAATEPGPGKDPDYTAGSLLGEYEGEFYLANVSFFRGTPKATEDFIRRTAERDGSDVPQRMEREGGASGVNTIDHYARRVFKGWDFRGIPASQIGNDEIRANPLSSVAERGHLWLVGNGGWIEDWLEQADAFPHAAHDDLISSSSGALYCHRTGFSSDPDPNLAGAADSWDDDFDDEPNI